MKVLELFSGIECMSNAFMERGHECYTVDWDTKFPSSLHIDIMQLKAEKILNEFWQPDVIWSSNVSQQGASIRGKAIRAAEYIKKRMKGGKNA